MDTETFIKFINLVKKNPILYDKRSGSYKRTDIKMKKWHEIATIMKFPDDDFAIKKWKYLRDKYVKIKRDGKVRPTGSGAEDIQEWSLLPYMDFLADYVQQRRHYSNIIQHDEEEVQETQEEDEVIHLEFEQPNETQDTPIIEEEGDTVDVDADNIPPEPSTKRTPAVTPKRSSTSQCRSQSWSPIPPSTTVDDALLHVGSYFAKKAAEDADSAFCNYVLAEMRKLQPPQKRQLRRIILDFIESVEYDNE